MMTPKDIVEYLSSAIVTRKECLDLALDSGLGKRIYIEKWILTEMLAKLIHLKKDGFVDHAEGEHKYPKRKTSKFEHCDLWWQAQDGEHWLEVKTLVLSDTPKKIGLKGLIKDLEKKNSLRPSDTFHHLVIVFHIEPQNRAFLDLKKELANIYSQRHMTFETEWDYPVWPVRLLHMSLYTLARG